MFLNCRKFQSKFSFFGRFVYKQESPETAKPDGKKPRESSSKGPPLPDYRAYGGSLTRGAERILERVDKPESTAKERDKRINTWFVLGKRLAQYLKNEGEDETLKRVEKVFQEVEGIPVQLDGIVFKDRKTSAQESGHFNSLSSFLSAVKAVKDAAENIVGGWWMGGWQKITQGDEDMELVIAAVAGDRALKEIAESRIDLYRWRPSPEGLKAIKAFVQERIKSPEYASYRKQLESACDALIRYSDETANNPILDIERIIRSVESTEVSNEFLAVVYGNRDARYESRSTSFINALLVQSALKSTPEQRYITLYTINQLRSLEDDDEAQGKAHIIISWWEKEMTRLRGGQSTT